MRSTGLIRAAKTGYIVLSLTLCALGLLLMLRPELSVALIGVIVGCVLVAFGVVKLIGYFSKDLYRLAFQFDLAFGILLLALGAALFAACFGLGCYEGSITYARSNSSMNFAGCAYQAMRNIEFLSQNQSGLSGLAPAVPDNLPATLAGLSLLLAALPAAFSALLSTLGERLNRTK